MPDGAERTPTQEVSLETNVFTAELQLFEPRCHSAARQLALLAKRTPLLGRSLTAGWMRGLLQTQTEGFKAVWSGWT